MATTFPTYEAAAEACPDTEDYMICGVRVSETEDAYLFLERSIPDEIAEAIFYEIRHGVAPTTYEKWVWGMARDRAEVDA